MLVPLAVVEHLHEFGQARVEDIELVLGEEGQDRESKGRSHLVELLRE